jgi:hypothetical protein
MFFLEYFNRNVAQIRLVDKKDSTLMKTINALLKASNALKITDINSFMTGYGTTIGRTIYESPGWKWSDEPTPHVLHELTHVVQFSPRMAMRYIFSPKWRMYYESECVQTEILLEPTRAHGPLWFEHKVSQFEKYGCDRQMIRSILRRRVIEVLDKQPLANPKKVHDAYKGWMRKYERS